MNLTEKQLNAKVSAGDGPNVELQAVLADDAGIAEALCAFANTRGGWLVAGVTTGGRWPGIADPEEAMSRIRLVAEQDIKPPLRIALHSVGSSRAQHGFVVAAQIESSDDRPHSIPGSGKSKRDILVRMGRANHVAEGATLNAMRSHRTQGKPKDALEAKIFSWMTLRARKSQAAGGDASPEDFAKAGKVGLRRASKAFIHMEQEGLLVGSGGRGDRRYTLP